MRSSEDNSALDEQGGRDYRNRSDDRGWIEGSEDTDSDTGATMMQPQHSPQLNEGQRA